MAPPDPVRIDFQVLDLSWTGLNQGWALASYSCSLSECVELLTTADGLHWTLAGKVPAKARCWLGTPCVSKIRFVNSQVGYAFKPDLMMTRDGGRSWKDLAGKTYALETAFGNVVRITAPNERCFPMCPLTVEKSSAGATSWRTALATLPGPADFASMQRNDDRIYAALAGNTAGGGHYVSPISTSSDGGAHWTRIADRCDWEGSMFVGMSAAPFGHLVVQCLIRARPGPASLLFVSRDSGATWKGPYPWSNSVDAYEGNGIAVSSRGVIVRVSGARWHSFQFGDAVIEVSTDHGRTWLKKADLGVAPTGTIWVGFENGLTGRAKVANLLWTTTDGGLSWTRAAI
jgi:photosystem II stability/assembly factor-like uncharacterized protein